MNKYLWLAVTKDKYELPLVVEDTSEKLAKKLNLTHGCVKAHEYNHRKRNVRKYNSNFDFKIVKVLNG
ncbi:hypothetical protein FDB42_12060 [Clostridium botulinum]|uniref:hypothetical protein n=1 Tax=Clostridium botulinum TaxID=1491 RepID=UPI001400EBC5|nr:hypothetical protein [Clostridium botulinum]MBN1058495.1 hypothetical protein [Clostridium botulinum]NFO40817.1 hypothetical protein [Clostridium botulinum]